METASASKPAPVYVGELFGSGGWIEFCRGGLADVREQIANRKEFGSKRMRLLSGEPPAEPVNPFADTPHVLWFHNDHLEWCNGGEFPDFASATGALKTERRGHRQKILPAGVPAHERYPAA